MAIVAEMKIVFLSLSCFLTMAAGTAVQVSVTCDNNLEFYGDGNLLVSNNNWQQTSYVTLPDCTEYVAIKCVDLHVVAGIIASFSNGVVTDSSWKCTNSYDANWLDNGFDDSGWANAYQISKMPTRYWPVRPGINSDAYWIWTTQWTGGDKNVYCRKKIQDCTTTTASPSSTGFDCGTNNPCSPLHVSGQYYYQHVDPTKFVQCSAWGQCFVMPCPAGLVWDPVAYACNWP